MSSSFDHRMVCDRRPFPLIPKVLFGNRRVSVLKRAGYVPTRELGNEKDSAKPNKRSLVPKFYLGTCLALHPSYGIV
jgi:hypothetical protein